MRTLIRLHLQALYGLAKLLTVNDLYENKVSLIRIILVHEHYWTMLHLIRYDLQLYFVPI